MCLGPIPSHHDQTLWQPDFCVRHIYVCPCAQCAHDHAQQAANRLACWTSVSTKGSAAVLAISPSSRGLRPSDLALCCRLFGDVPHRRLPRRCPDRQAAVLRALTRRCCDTVCMMRLCALAYYCVKASREARCLGVQHSAGACCCFQFCTLEAATLARSHPDLGNALSVCAAWIVLHIRDRCSVG